MLITVADRDWTCGEEEVNFRVMKLTPGMVGRLLLLGFTCAVPGMGIYLSLTSISIYRPRLFDQVQFTRAARWVRRQKPAPGQHAFLLLRGMQRISVTRRAYYTDELVFIPIEGPSAAPERPSPRFAGERTGECRPS